MENPMNDMMARGVAGVLQHLISPNFDAAGWFPCRDKSTPTYSSFCGNQRHFLSFKVRWYFLATRQTLRRIIKALSSVKACSRTSSIIIKDPSSIE
eukprot:scaffold64512_cov83-Attheya_sp.AAC.1